MTANSTINTVLCSLSNLENKYNFIEDADVSFLNEFFKRYQSLILMKETLENHSSYDDVIEDKTLETLTDIIRKNSKKNREAGKLYHILKKVHFKALFSCLKELNNEEYIPISHCGSLQEIDINFKKTEDYYDGHSESEDIDQSSLYSENSEISEDVSNHNFNLPTYEDIKYNENKGFSPVPDVQIISVKREPNQPLGITVVKTKILNDDKSINRCAIERILVNSLIDKQGLLQVGDVILEVNEKPIENPEELQFLLGKCKGTIAFKILKTSKRPTSNAVNVEKVYIRALFDYDPSKDKLLPAEQIGLAFKAGDVFEVLNRDDPSFWQAVPLESVDNQAFLIPSQSLQERLIALRNDHNPRSNENISGKSKRKKSKKNEIFRAKDAADMVSEADLHTYEEVVKFPPSRVPCVLLIGPSGVGKKAIKHLLVQKEPHRFSFPIQDTSEAKKSRNQPLFNHVDRNTMTNDIRASLYVCLEEKSGELYGIKSSAIRELINQGKTVVLDCQPKEVYHLKTSLFNPYVILIGAPVLTVLEAMQKEGLQKNFTKNKRSTAELEDIINQSNDFEIMYKHLINIIIVNDDIHQTTKHISSILSDFENNTSWIPASWEFDMAPLPINKPVNNKTMKSVDNSTLNSTGGRRYEKRNEKPSVSLSSNKVPINNQNEYSSQDDDDDDEEEESDTNSEENVVMAKPVKFLNASKPEETLDRTDAKPVKYSNSKKLDDKNPLKHSNSKTTDNVPIKHSNSKATDNAPIKHSNSKATDNAPIKHSNSKTTDNTPIKHSNSKSDDKLFKKPEDKSIKHSNSKSDEKLSKQHSSVKKEEKPLKSSNSKKTEDVPLRKDERPIVKHSTSRKSEEVSPKVKEKSIEIVTPAIQISNKSNQPLESSKTTNSTNKNPKAPVIASKPKVIINQNVITPRNKNKPPEVNQEENIENNRRVSQQKPVSTKAQPQSIDRRMKIVRKENSSSEISDTSSESDDGRFVENRV